MLELPLVTEARRQLDVCNACRYCEGLCAVFPALERRAAFAEGDITFLASLCHDCRSCFDACPYAPPHELAIDLPRLLSSVREKSHAGYAWPSAIAKRIDRRLGNALVLMLSFAVFVVLATILGAGVERMFAIHAGRGAFYEVIPWLAMLLPFMALSLAVLAVMIAAGARFWHGTSTEDRGNLRPSSVIAALWDAATLAYLRGGGPGCTYPDGEPNLRRRVFHSFVFYGFLSAFASTVSAAVLQDLMGVEPPYDIWSVPVVLGIAGGAAMLIGCTGLLLLKPASPPERTAAGMRVMDLAFLIALTAVNLSGFAVLLLRETALLGITMAIHLGFTASLFVALPYGKFAHAIYRTLALIRNRREMRGH